MAASRRCTDCRSAACSSALASWWRRMLLRSRSARLAAGLLRRGGSLDGGAEVGLDVGPGVVDE
eukprot:2331356-Pyramimonas_sp.AAC.1